MGRKIILPLFLGYQVLGIRAPGLLVGFGVEAACFVGSLLWWGGLGVDRFRRWVGSLVSNCSSIPRENATAMPFDAPPAVAGSSVARLSVRMTGPMRIGASHICQRQADMGTRLSWARFVLPDDAGGIDLRR